jgi:hypothetical protein
MMMATRRILRRITEVCGSDEKKEKSWQLIMTVFSWDQTLSCVWRHGAVGDDMMTRLRMNRLSRRRNEYPQRRKLPAGLTSEDATSSNQVRKNRE